MAQRGASFSQFLPFGEALHPPRASRVPSVQERERGDIGAALSAADAFPKYSGPATHASYGVYPAFQDPFRLAPYGNVVYSATGYPQ
jgi:hypothetical protein